MKHCLAILCLIAVCEAAVSAQNLTQMVSTPAAADSAKTVAPANNPFNKPLEVKSPNQSVSDIESVSEKLSKSEKIDTSLLPGTGGRDEAPLVNISIIGLRSSLFSYQPPPNAPQSLLARAEALNREAIFQRKRFDETGQAIVMESGHLYYRRDNFSYTKGIILHSFMDGKMDVGIFRSHFSPADGALSGKITASTYQQDANGALFRNGARVFFAVRMRIPTP